MTEVHVALPGTDRAACDAGTGEVIPFEEALRPDGRHFDCVECHKALTGGRKHSRP